MEHFPLTKEEAIKKGYNWQDNIQKTTGKETLKPENIPESYRGNRGFDFRMKYLLVLNAREITKLFLMN